MRDFFIQHTSEFITALIAVIVGWIGKSKTSKKVEDADLTTKIQLIYKDMIADTDRMIDKNTAEIESLKKKLDEKDVYWQEELKKADAKWLQKYNLLKNENGKLKQRIGELERHEK